MEHHNDYMSNFLLSLSTFLIWLTTFLNNHAIGIMTFVVLFFTALNQYSGWRKNKAEEKKIEKETSK